MNNQRIESNGYIIDIETDGGITVVEKSTSHTLFKQESSFPTKKKPEYKYTLLNTDPYNVDYRAVFDEVFAELLEKTNTVFDDFNSFFNKYELNTCVAGIPATLNVTVDTEFDIPTVNLRYGWKRQLANFLYNIPSIEVVDLHLPGIQDTEIIAEQLTDDIRVSVEYYANGINQKRSDGKLVDGIFETLPTKAVNKVSALIEALGEVYNIQCKMYKGKIPENVKQGVLNGLFDNASMDEIDPAVIGEINAVIADMFGDWSLEQWPVDIVN